MKNIVGKLTINYYSQKGGARVYFPKELLKLLGNEIVFNLRHMTIRRPTLDSRHTLSIKYCQFSFYPKEKELSEYVGKYNVIQKDEDTFKLKKIKDD